MRDIHLFTSGVVGAERLLFLRNSSANGGPSSSCLRLTGTGSVYSIRKKQKTS